MGPLLADDERRPPQSKRAKTARRLSIQTKVVSGSLDEREADLDQVCDKMPLQVSSIWSASVTREKARGRAAGRRRPARVGPEKTRQKERKGRTNRERTVTAKP